MTKATKTTEAAAPKAATKKSIADAIFAVKLVEREQGLFANNKQFRAAVIDAIQAEAGVTTSSAATMYNAAKKEAEAANPDLGLGRDPKKEKPVSTGKRGRPAGSKNKSKKAIVETNDTEVTEAEKVADPVA